MGKVMTKLKVTNATDFEIAHRGLIAPEAVRSVEIDALVDTGATMLALPENVVEAAGLPVYGNRPIRDALGRVSRVPWVGGVRIEILGREMTCDALVVPRGARALIGQIPLEGLDLVVDPKTQEARVNPASPDAPLMDLMYAA